jgi:error-prone DNA polymerase
VAVTGEVQQESNVIHVIASKLDDLTRLLARLTEHAPPIESLARADAVKRPHDEDIDSRARGRRNPPRIAAPAELPDFVASDLDVPARGSAHAPSRAAARRSPAANRTAPERVGQQASRLTAAPRHRGRH